MSSKQLVVIGLLGSTLDRGSKPSRWEKWRPTVSLFQHEDLLIDTFELLFQDKFSKLAQLVAEDIQSVSPETTVNLRQVEFEDPWSLENVYTALHEFAGAYSFDLERNDYLIHITTGTHVAQICEFLLTESRRLPARLIQTRPPQKRGANRSEHGHYTIIDLDLSRYDEIARRFERERQDDLSFLKSGIATQNAAFNRLIEEIEKVSILSRDPILLMGPTGAGKTQLAKRIYELKERRHQVGGPFVELNCATLRGDQAMSALFGHTKGAFTGAMKDRPGLMKAANQGVLFLDEIGELGADEQAMLLRALETGRFLPMGSDREQSSDFQLIAGTNRDLREQVNAGEFREDLLARINIWTFDLPGLRQRLEDIEPNLDFELAKYSARTGTRVTFNKEARTRFLKFALSESARWRGNFRDLGAAVTRLATLAERGRIVSEDVDREIDRLLSTWRGLESDVGASNETFIRELKGDEYVDKLDRFDVVQLAEVVAVCRTSKSMSEAGRRLFAVSREQKANPNDADRIRKYLLRFDLDFKEIQAFG